MAKKLSEWAEDELLPSIFENLSTAFPEFGWVKDGAQGWKATKSPLDARADRIVCHKPYGFLIHGGEAVAWLSYVNGGTKPTGPEYSKALHDLAHRVGMVLPAKEETAEDRAKREAREKTKDLVEALIRYCHKTLLDAPEAKEAREYLESRGLPRDRWEAWELGWMPKDTPPLVQWIESTLKGWTWEQAKAVLVEEGLLKVKDEETGEALRAPKVRHGGYVVSPWRGPSGEVLTLWGRKLPSGHERAAKYLFSAGKPKASPYLLNRSPKGGRLLVVEGLFDAIQCREHGLQAVALGGAALGDLLPALKLHRPDELTLVMDPDEAGEKAAGKIVDELLEAGLTFYVVELPKDEGGEKLDPDTFLRSFGADALKRLVDEAPNGLRWKARNLLDAHRGDGWTDKRTDSALREAVAFAGKLPAALLPSVFEKYWGEISGELVFDPETVQNHSRTLEEEKELERHEREVRLHVQETTQKVSKLLEAGKVMEARAVLLEEATLIRAKALKSSRPAPKVVSEEMEDFEKYLSELRGRDRVGMSQDSLPGLDEALMGLRGLMLVAGPPGSGKTSLAVQLGLSAMEADESAAVILISLEQSRMEHLTRNLAYFSELPWKTVAMGSPEYLHGAERLKGSFFSPQDRKQLREGEARLKALGSRFLILDDRNFGDPTPENILQEWEKLREKTGASKVLVIVDYLQLWPLTDEAKRSNRTDLDRDKWQIGELKTLRNLLGPGDAVMGISEAVKQDWKAGLGMSSVMGSARGSYTPDVVMVVQPVGVDDLLPKDSGERGSGAQGRDREKERDEAERRLRALYATGRNPTRLQIVKGRDGVDRRSFELVFHFEVLRFEESSLQSELDRL